MGLNCSTFLEFDSDKQKIVVMTLILPPPLSLDTFFYLSDISPVKLLNIGEEMVRSRFLAKYAEMGLGHYVLTDFDQARSCIKSLPRDFVTHTVSQVLDKIKKVGNDGPKDWLSIAHIYDMTGIPVRHFREVILAGNYCNEHKLHVDAAHYYCLALKSLDEASLETLEKGLFIDAVSNSCTVRNETLSQGLMIRFLDKALTHIKREKNPEKEVWLNVLLARFLVKTGHSREASSKIEYAWQMMASRDFPREFRLKVALAYADILFFQGFVREAIERYEGEIENHEVLPSDRETLRQCAFQGWIYGVLGETARGMGLTESVYAKAQRQNDTELSVYATLIQVLILLEARLMSETEKYLNHLFEFDPIYVDNYTLRVGAAVRAFIAYLKGNYEDSFRYQNEVYRFSLNLENFHHRGPVNYEYMVGLEERGLKHPHWNFDFELERIFSWPDIYMKGAALRFRALRCYKRREPSEGIKADLMESIRLLEESGARIELSQSQILLAQILIEDNEQTKAKTLLKASWDVLSRSNPELFPQDLKPYLGSDSKRSLWVDSLLAVGEALGAVRDRKQLLREIVRQGMRLVGAERGAIFLKNETGIETAANRNMDTLHIFSDSFKHQKKIIEKVFESGNECIQNNMSLQALGKDGSPSLGWLGCFPISLDANVLGVIYLDCKLIRLDFSEDEVRLLRIMSNQAAVALASLTYREKKADSGRPLRVDVTPSPRPGTGKICLENLVGSSPAFKKLVAMIEHVAFSNSTVMLTGETGVGKDMVAQAIHQCSCRAQGPFIAVNLVSLSPELFASELFGHEKGAFTGAVQSRQGRFELASEGTLFLDDIDACSLDIQAKLLRVLETREFERVGGNRTLKTKFRLIAASNRNIEELVDRDLFRSDFYYRLNVFPIKIPPLRERQDDIPDLVYHYMKVFQQKTGKRFKSICRDSMQRLLDYSWPGNVRELKHVIERAVLMCKEGCLYIPDLDEQVTKPERNAGRVMTLREMEVAHITKALKMCKGKVSGAGGCARLLDVKPSTLYAKLKRLGLARGDYKSKQ